MRPPAVADSVPPIVTPTPGVAGRPAISIAPVPFAKTVDPFDTVTVDPADESPSVNVPPNANNDCPDCTTSGLAADPIVSPPAPVLTSVDPADPPTGPANVTIASAGVTATVAMPAPIVTAPPNATLPVASNVAPALIVIELATPRFAAEPTRS